MKHSTLHSQVHAGHDARDQIQKEPTQQDDAGRHTGSNPSEQQLFAMACDSNKLVQTPDAVVLAKYHPGLQVMSCMFEPTGCCSVGPGSQSHVTTCVRDSAKKQLFLAS